MATATAAAMAFDVSPSTLGLPISGETVAALVCGFLVAVFLYICWRQIRAKFRSQKMKRRNYDAIAAENEAGRLLEATGYTLLGAQLRHSYVLTVDGVPQSIELRADYVVEKAGRTFVAEVKSGIVSAKLETAATRRQMLEYAVAFGTDGVLLVDMPAKKIRDVVFPRFESEA